MVLLQIIIATLCVGLISFAGVILFGFKLNARKVTFYLISLASGTMLGASLLHLIPEAFEHNPDHAPLNIAAGVFIFFIFEKLLIWRHCHHHQRPEDHHRPVAARMILVGDGVHNFIDGVIIASAFMAGPSIGISITLAILLHELPQEMGDFGVLIHGGFNLKQAAAANAISAAAAVVGGIVAYFSLNALPIIQHTVLPVFAGGFLYIALADLIPQLHERLDIQQTLTQIALLALGFGTLYVLLPH